MADQKEKGGGLIIAALMIFYLVVNIARALFKPLFILSILLTLIWLWDRLSGYSSSEELTWAWLIILGLTILFWFVGYGITGTSVGQDFYEIGGTFHNASSEMTEAQMEIVDESEKAALDSGNNNRSTEVEESTKRAFDMARFLIWVDSLTPTFP